MGSSSEVQKSSRKLAALYRLHAPVTIAAHPDSQENKQIYQEVGLAKQTTQVRAPMQKGSVQKAEAEISKKEVFRNNAWA